jgi:hypothetical protein
MAEVKRWIDYADDGQPWLFIAPKVNPEKYIPTGFAQGSAWLYSFDHNPDFDKFMWRACGDICARYNLGLITAQKMGAIASVIEEGISELLAAPPRESKVDMAVRQMREEAMKKAAANAEVDGNRVKMTIEIPA